MKAGTLVGEDADVILGGLSSRGSEWMLSGLDGSDSMDVWEDGRE